MPMLSKVQKIEGSWELNASVQEKRTGAGSNGENYYIVKIGGFTFFNEELYHRVEEGDRVILKGEYTGDRYSRKNQSYQPQHELEDVIVQGAFVDSSTTIPRAPVANGNGISKGQPA